VHGPVRVSSCSLSADIGMVLCLCMIGWSFLYMAELCMHGLFLCFFALLSIYILFCCLRGKVEASLSISGDQSG
jgi:hypothetical protein